MSDSEMNEARHIAQEMRTGHQQEAAAELSRTLFQLRQQERMGGVQGYMAYQEEGALHNDLRKMGVHEQATANGGEMISLNVPPIKEFNQHGMGQPGYPPPELWPQGYPPQGFPPQMAGAEYPQNYGQPQVGLQLNLDWLVENLVGRPAYWPHRYRR